MSKKQKQRLQYASTHGILKRPAAARCRKCRGLLDKSGNCSWCKYKESGVIPGANKKPKKGKRERPIYAGSQEKYQGILERQNKYGLKPLIFGTTPQTVYGTINRWEFVLSALRRFERQPSQEKLETYLVAVRKHEHAPWWVTERDRFEQHFGHLLPPSLPAPTFKAHEGAEEE